MQAFSPERLKKLRIELGLSGRKMADDLGLSSGYISQMEGGTKSPSPALNKLILSAYSVSAHWWETGEGEMFSKGGGDSQALDRELMIEAIITIGMTEKEIGVTLKPEKRAELVMMIYDEYYAGEEVKPAKVIQLVKLAA